jgi:hypothetical protein
VRILNFAQDIEPLGQMGSAKDTRNILYY